VQMQARGVIAVESVPKQETRKYGIAAVDQMDLNQAQVLRGIVEKPAPKDAPSSFAVAGRYILPPTIFNYLEHLHPGTGGEIQLTDAIAQLLRHEPVYMLPFAGHRYDCGSKLGYIQATINYALKHEEIGEALAQYLQQLKQHKTRAVE